jgi:gluconokinase
MVMVLMGPAGSGKTTLGIALARALGWTFVDADDHHPRANLEKMAAGHGLTDADRAGWLASVHKLIARALDRRESMVVACSALAARHRAQLTGTLRPIRFVYLEAPEAVLRERLDTRVGHVVSAALLDSQLATLEKPGDEALTLDATRDVETLIGYVRREFGV